MEIEKDAGEGEDLRETLAAAIAETVDNGGEGEAEAEAPAAPEREAGEAGGEGDGEARAERDDGRDNKGRFKGKEKPPEETKPTEGQGEEFKTGTDQPQKQGQTLRAPQSWKPLHREQFGKLPPDLQAEIVRRETEIATTLQQTAEARRGFDQFRQVIAPFAGMLQAEGAEPIKAVQSLLNTAMMLRTAPAVHKADQIANMVMQFLPGVEGLKLLDRALHSRLNGAQGQPSPQGIDQPFPRDPRVDKLFQTIDSLANQRKAERKAAHEAEWSKFAESHEFFEDVKDTMEILLTASERKGLPMTRDEAYARACKLDPQISEVLAQREAAKAAKAHNASTQRARAAASSVSTRPAVRDSDADEESDDLRETIRKASIESARRNR